MNCTGKKIKVELDFFNYAIKYDLKVAASTNIFEFAVKTDLSK